MTRFLLLLLFSATTAAAAPTLQETESRFWLGCYQNARVTTLGGTTIAETPAAQRESYLTGPTPLGPAGIAAINLNNLVGSQALGGLARTNATMSTFWTYIAPGTSKIYPYSSAVIQIDNKSQAWTQSGRPHSSVTGSQVRRYDVLDSPGPTTFTASLNLWAKFTDAMANQSKPDDSILLTASWGNLATLLISIEAVYDRDTNTWSITRRAKSGGNEITTITTHSGPDLNRNYTLTSWGRSGDQLESVVQIGPVREPPADDLWWIYGDDTTYIVSPTLPNASGFATIRDDTWKATVTLTLMHSVSN